MNRTEFRRTAWLVTLLGATCLACACSGARKARPEVPVDDPAVEAVALYDRGRYEEARQRFEQLDAESRATGPVLYRLAFCERQAGETALGLETLHRSRTLLEQDLPRANGLETPFYLANAYQQLERLEDMRRVAAATTSRVESGEFGPVESALEMFRLGKLYADQDRREEATHWYGRALEGLRTSPEDYGAYIRWASSYAEPKPAGTSAAPVVANEKPPAAGTGAAPDELDRLAVEQARAGHFLEAQQIWRKAELLAPASADRARYCQQLARMAAELDTYPSQAPDGRPWAALSKGDLETLLQAQTQIVREVKKSVLEAGADLTTTERQALNSKLIDAKPAFAAAGLEYALRGHSIRETAFFGGFAPLIFGQDEWTLPRVRRQPGGAGKPRADRPGRPAPGS